MSKEKKKISKKQHTILKVILSLFIVTFIVAALGLGIVSAMIVAIIKTTPPLDPALTTPTNYTSLIYDDENKEIDRLHAKEDRIYVELREIPEYLQNAFIAIEDERFREHNGIDTRGIARAMVANVKSFSFREGASTITQQLIKNTLLKSEKKLERKIREQYLAVELEKILSKDQILEKYLNTIHLGHNINGVQAASQNYFNKDVSEVTLAESAVIASITKAPTKYSPVSNPENNRERQKLVLRKMLEQGFITNEDYEEALDEDVYSKAKHYGQKTTQKVMHSYFVDAVTEQVLDDLVEQKGYTRDMARTALFTGGLKIYTTMDANIQQTLEEKFKDDSLFPKYDKYWKLEYTLSFQDPKKPKSTNKFVEKYFKTLEEGNIFVEQYKEKYLTEDMIFLGEKKYYIPEPQASMVITDYRTGEIKAIIGGRGEKQVNRGLNRAIDGLRQPGSTFKVLGAFAPAIDTKTATAATIYDDVPYNLGPTYDNKEILNWYNNSATNIYYRGLSTIRQGTRDSMNIVAVKSLMDVGIDTSFNYLKNFGFTTLVDSEAKNGKIYTDRTPSLALGGLTDGVNMLELTSAYGTIANSGVYVKPILYTKVIDIKGNVILNNNSAKQRSRRVLSEEAAFIVNDTLIDVMYYGTGTTARPNISSMKFAGKTGTSSKNRDLVFAGYSPYYASAIWLGHDKANLHPFEGVIPKTGRSAHKKIWQAVFTEIHKDLKPKSLQRQPEDVVSARISIESGKLAVEGVSDQNPRYLEYKDSGYSYYFREPAVRNEYFIKGTEPTEYDDVNIKATVTKDLKLATEYCSDDEVFEKIFIKRSVPVMEPTETIDEEGNIVEANEKHKKIHILDAKYELPTEYCDKHEELKVTKPTDDSFDFLFN